MAGTSRDVGGYRLMRRSVGRQAVVMTIGDQTSVFLTAIAQGLELARYPAGIVILGRFDKGLGRLPTDVDERLEAVLARLHD